MRDMNETTSGNKFYLFFHVENNICTYEYNQNKEENDEIKTIN